jgi:transposase InsO family protein
VDSGRPTTTPAPTAGSSITKRFNVFGVRKDYGYRSGADARHGSSTAPPAVVADAPNRVWAVDFQFDVTTDGRPIKIVSITDEHTRECLGGMVERSITGEHLIGELDRVAAARGTFATVLTLRQRTRISLWRNGRLGSQSVWPSVHRARPTVAQRLC